MDELDMAQDAIDGEVTKRIAAARRQESIPATGFCLNCGEALKEGLRWCDADCRDDWSRQRRLPVPPSDPGAGSEGGSTPEGGSAAE